MIERMNPLIKVAVIGSCVSRDIFNRTFNPGYKDIFECVALANQVSFVSLMSDPIEVNPEDLNGLNPRVHGELSREFSRHFLIELLDTQPDYVIMDFRPDIVFGFDDLNTGGTVTHNTWSTTKTRFYQEREATWFRADRTPEQFYARWNDAVDRFIGWLNANLPKTKIIVHKARNIATWTTRAGEVKRFSPWSLRMNRHWDIMDDYVSAKPGVSTIDVLMPGQQSFEEHPWGPSALHYTFDYHQRFLTRLSRMALDDAVAAARNQTA